ncbi:MAG TPA: hypothetical protein VLS89_14780 [Candidatus Nanopelagicales bacterium]|nr:hypothetical protein [Candidatus Nanopelagicales bacterium]
MADSLLDDPWIAAQIEAAVAPYAGRLPARKLAWMREQLAELLTRDETAARLLRSAHPREADRSGERVAPGMDPSDQDGERGPGRAKAG